MQNTHAVIQVNHHSIAAAAGALKIPVALLRQAKKAGADGFRANGNIDLIELVRWFVTKGQDFKPRRNLEESKALLAEAQADRITHQAAVERGDLCPIEKQARALAMIVHMLFVCIRQTSHIVSHEVNATRHAEIGDAFTDGFFNMLLDAVAAVAGYKNLELPGWSIDAIRKGTENTFSNDEADFKKRAEYLGEILAGRTVEQIEKRLAKL